jgi:hypothetical protein
VWASRSGSGIPAERRGRVLLALLRCAKKGTAPVFPAHGSNTHGLPQEGWRSDGGAFHPGTPLPLSGPHGSAAHGIPALAGAQAAGSARRTSESPRVLGPPQTSWGLGRASAPQLLLCLEVAMRVLEPLGIP